MRIMLNPDQIEKLIKGEIVKTQSVEARESFAAKLSRFGGGDTVEIAFSDIGYQRIIDIAQKGLKEING